MSCRMATGRGDVAPGLNLRAKRTACMATTCQWSSDAPGPPPPDGVCDLAAARNPPAACSTSSHNFAEICLLGFVMRLNISKCKDLLKHAQLGNIAEVIELLARKDVDANYSTKVNRTTALEHNAITFAAAGGHVEIVQLLLENGANADCHHEYEGSPLHQAIEHGHAQAALVIIHQGGMNLQRLHPYSYSTGGMAIRHALEHKLFDVVHGLLQAGAYARPMGLAANALYYWDVTSDLLIHGDASICKEVLINHKNMWEGNRQVPSLIFKHAVPEVVEAFLEAGGNFDHLGHLFSQSLLSINRAELADTLGVRKIFLEQICHLKIRDVCWIFPEINWEDEAHSLVSFRDINVRGALGITPLMLAAQLGRDGLVDQMIKAGADITAINELGGTALTMAVRAGKEKVVEKLVSASKIALFSDAVVGNDVEKVRDFVKLRQIDVNHADNNGKNALMHACEKDNLEMAEVVLGDKMWVFDSFQKYERVAPVEMRADINAKNADGNTALAEACKNGRNAVVHFLLEKGANVNSRNHDDDSALALSCKSGNIDAAKLLLLNGASINSQNAEGNTALMISCSNKDAGMVDLLVSGIQKTVITVVNTEKEKFLCANILDVDVKNNAGQTALMLGYMGEVDFEIINSVMSAEPKDKGPFDIDGQKIHYCESSFDAVNDLGYGDWDAGSKKPRTALLRKDQHDELHGIDDQQEVQLLALPYAPADLAFDAAANAGDEGLALAFVSDGHLL